MEINLKQIIRWQLLEKYGEDDEVLLLLLEEQVKR
jgi:hypothetical protein